MKYIECPQEYQCAGSDLTLFLGGGITNCPEWQKEIVNKLSATEITLLNPRRKEWEFRKIDNVAQGSNIEKEQIEWEHRHLLRADAILFWFPCETLCPIALYELGAWNFRPKTLFIGTHPDYARRRDVEIQTKLERGSQVVVGSLDGLVKQVMEWIKK